MTHLRPGLDFGRFKNIERLAEGGEGIVLGAYDPAIRRSVAIKILRPDREGDRIKIGKFQREAQITGGLEHPNIVPIYDMGQPPDGSIYFVMRRVSGQSFAELIDDRKAAVRKARQMHDGTPLLNSFLKACDAIACAHSRG